MKGFHREKEKMNESVSHRSLTLSEKRLKVLERDLEAAATTQLASKRLSL